MIAAPAALQAQLALPWSSPWPALLLDAQSQIRDANPAFEALLGLPRSALIGRDPIELQAPEERESDRLDRDAWLKALRPGQHHALSDRRLVDAAGHGRWVRATYSVLSDTDERWVLALYQDTGAEHAARMLAERSLGELAQWFDLSPTGMLVFDPSGLIVRSNRAFESLVGRVPVSLREAAADLQALLAWHEDQPLAELRPQAPPVDAQGLVQTPDGRRRLRARVSVFETESGERRYLAVVEDRSVEDERDLAQLERGALMDTASIGVATYDSQRGWVQPAAGPSPRDSARPATALQGIGRDLVEPESLPEYERLQRALRAGERAEVRYAVRHPELGQRWLLTRIEPGALAGGRRATSVVTLDVTEQVRANRRNEQLLRELGTILEGSTAGIAYLRGGVLVRCNRVFERMLAMAPGAGAGATLEEAFAPNPANARAARGAAVAAAEGSDFEAELAFETAPAGGTRWLRLSVRAADSTTGEPEAVAVLTDITRLKTQQAELEALLRDRELMFSLSEVGIVYQRGSRIERANQAMASMTGYSAPELTALDAAELYESARHCVEFETRLGDALRSDGRFVGERRLRRRDGSLRWVQVGARRVDAGMPGEGVICSFVDVDELHRVRETLVRQAERTRSILDSVLVGIVTVADGAIEWMNRSARRMFGGELADFVGESISIVATPEAGHPLRRTDYVDRLAEGQAETFECRLRGRDGREFWVVGNAVLTSRESRGDQLTFALLDIEQRRQAEINIAQARSSLQRVIDTAPLAIALLDAVDRQVLQRNQTAAQFLDPPPRGFDEALAALAMHGGEAVVEELRQSPGRGQPDRLWDTRLVALPAHAGAPAQWLVVASDVTEQREADRARLQAAITQREVLVKEVHHRIKNNLQGVAGLLQQHAERQPQVAATLGEAVAQVRAIAQVYGLQVGASGLLRLERVVEAIAQSVQRTFGRAIAFAPAPDDSADFVLPEAESIPIALTLNELLTNTVKHGDGEVRCSLRAEGAAGEVAVIEMRHAGELPPDFTVDRIRGGVSGLGLVRALLPRRSAEFALTARDGEVCTTVTLRRPSVQRESAAIGHNQAQETSA